MLCTRNSRPRKGFIAALLILCVAVVACSSGGGKSGGTSGTVNIGFVAALTGQYAAVGQSKSEGVGLATSLINKAGGVLGNNLKIISVEGSDPVDLVPSVRQMLAVDNVKAVVGFSIIDYQDALPIVNAAKMVSFTYIGSSALDKQVMPYSFRMAPSDSLVGAAMGAAVAELGYKRVATVFDTTQGAAGLVAPAVDALKKERITVAGQISLPANVTSYEAEAAQLVSLHPDAVLLQMQPTLAGPFFQELSAAGGGSIPVIGSDLTAPVEWLKAAGQTDAKNQVVSVVPGGATGPAVAEFDQAYQAAYHHPSRAWAIHFYDGVNIAALAMTDCKSTDPEVYARCVLDVTTPGSNVTIVYNYADGKKLLAEGKKIKYSGAGSPMTFNHFHAVTGGFQVVRVAISGSQTVLKEVTANDLVKLIQ